MYPLTFYFHSTLKVDTVLLKKILRKKLFRHSVGAFDGHFKVSLDPQFFEGIFLRTEHQGSGKGIKFVLEVWNLQKWISHTQKPIPRHKKIQNPSNSSKVIERLSSKKFQIFPKLRINITFEPFDGFWIFLCLGIGFWVWGIHFWGFQTSRTIFDGFPRTLRPVSRKDALKKFWGNA